jgi:hypothetical protein
MFSVLHWLAHPRWQLLALGAFISGLGLATHLLFGIAFVVSTVYVSLIALRDCSKGSKTFHLRSWPTLNTLTLSAVLRSLLVLSALLLAFAPWWIQFARMVNLIGLQSTLSLVTTGPTLLKRVVDASFQHLLFNFGEYAVWLTYQFLPPGLLLGAFGSFVMLRRQPRFAFYPAVMFASYVFFSSNFDEPDRFNFHLPSYAVFALGIASGSAEMKKWLIARGWTGLRTSSVLASMLICSAALPPLLYAITPGALEAAGINEAKLGVQPIGTWKRQTLSYFLTPSKRGDNSAARFGRSTLQNLAPDALVISPGGTEQEAFVVLRYFQTVEGMRPDVRLELMLNGDWKDTPGSVLELVRQQQKCRPIYFTSTNPGSFHLQARADC